MTAEDFDVLVVGAGISGLGAAYHLKRQCPHRTFAILEARQALGGTWDVFRYPGIRSDSDMHTFGYAFRPWPQPKAIADGPSILAYLEDTARQFGLDRHLRHGLRVTLARWSSADSRWTVEATQADGTVRHFTCRFLSMCTGYFRHDQGHTPDFPGREAFRGQVVHPQHWTDDVVHAGKKVVVIGSGATAITLVPALARTAAQVTMVQRSPTYVAAAPSVDGWAALFHRLLPEALAHGLTRWKNILFGILFYQFCRLFPGAARQLLLAGVARELGPHVPVEPHFSPRYAPWDQRLCLAPDGDFFAALREGRAQVVTDEVQGFTASGLRLASGRELEADLVVTATGFSLQVLGGAKVVVDGRELRGPELLVYRGCLLSGVPNFAFAVGYTNASWTLKVDLVAEYFCRLLNELEARGLGVFVVSPGDPPPRPRPLLDFGAGYVKRSEHLLPHQGERLPWRLYQNYVLDVLLLRHGALEDGALHFLPAGATRAAPQPTDATLQA